MKDTLTASKWATSVDSRQVSVIERWRDFDNLADEWNGLLGRSAADTLFLTREWIQAWREATRDRYTPFVVTVRENDGTLIGLAPFYTSTLYLVNALPYRTLRMMADYATGAEYPNVIVAKGTEERVYPLLTECLRLHSSRWDCIWLPNWRGWDDTFSTFLDYLDREPDLDFYYRPVDFSCISLADSVETLLKSMSKSRRYSFRRLIKKISTMDDVSIHWCRDADELPHYLETLFELHYKRWSNAGEAGSFNRKPLLRHFYRSFTPKALDKGWLRIARLDHRGETRAIQLGYVYKNVFHQMQEGFDPQFVDGVGNYLRIKVLEQCIDEGITEYDFLGGFSEHKRRWGAEQRVGYELFSWRKTLKTLPFSVRPIWPTGRYMSSSVSND